MNLVDVHAHLEIIKDLDEVVARAAEAGVKIIIANGVNVETNRKAIEFSEKYDIVKFALGIYPNDCLEMSEKEIDDEIHFIKSKKPLAIGECGLDFKEEVDKEKMLDCFEKQINLAKDLDIPVIVHSRKAELECIEILEKLECKKVVMHCFCGKMKLVQRVIENGWYFSIPCNVLKSQHFQQVVQKTPFKQLLTETDAPFLSPYADKQSEPFFIKGTIEKIAEIKKMDEQEIANQVFMNYQRLFL